MKKSKSYFLGPLEQEIMDYLWDGNGKKISEVHKYLTKKRSIAYTTVMTVMSRLVKKGLLVRKKSGKAYLYTPTTTRKQTIKTLVRKALDSLINQFGEEALVAFSDELNYASYNKKDEKSN